MTLRAFIKRSLPAKLRSRIHYIVFKKQSRIYYTYDAERFSQHSNAHYKNINQNKLLGQITAEYHAIEKGLTMPNMRLGFGLETMINLISHCNLYTIKFDIRNEQFLHASSVIAEYKEVHKVNNFQLDQTLTNSIDKFLSKIEISHPSEQLKTTKKEYFQHTNDSFYNFSQSRHSVRNFTGNVDSNLLKKAISLAQNAPSACNRQPSRVYIIKDTKLQDKILALQSGNRGFGHLADKLLILTAELGVFLSLPERNDVYVNGGIFSMNLLYALHYYQIGACPLNWCATPQQDQALRKIIAIKPSETVILIIACGNVPDEFQLANSPKISPESITKII